VQLFVQELEQAFDLIKATPFLGSVYARKRDTAIRCVLMPKTKYHLYFRQDGPEGDPRSRRLGSAARMQPEALS
jgi:hypothetical protein